MSKPTPAILNAIAAVELSGDAFPHTAMNTRLALYDYTRFVFADVEMIAAAREAGTPVPCRALTDEGRALLPQAPLWKAAQFLIAKGYRIDKGRRNKPGYVVFTRFDDVKECFRSAFISRGRHVYEPTEGLGSGYANTFTA